MTLQERINAFINLGKEISKILEGVPATEAGKKCTELMPEFHHRNGWYSESNVRHRLHVIAAGLTENVMTKWLSDYEILADEKLKKVGVILAGNIPLVGFDDFRCVLISGNVFFGKLSSDDKFLLPLIAEILIEIEPQFSDRIQFTEDQLKEIDAIIATGSNNSTRYFEHYFSRFPHIIRGNRNGVAILTGKETAEELSKLGDDIFRYFGLGCRNVTKLFVPENYNFNLFFESIFEKGEDLLVNNKYMNNYDYHKVLYLLSSIPLLDNNFLLLKEDEKTASPPGVIFYERYSSTDDLHQKLSKIAEQIQCTISIDENISGAIRPGDSQLAGPADYADGIDVLKFLVNLN
ncbi:acyl-CoA reductase [soil metagenome]